MDAHCLLGMELQILERSVSGQDMKGIIEDLTHFFELFWRVKLDVES
jgi:hypothetical protein